MMSNKSVTLEPRYFLDKNWKISKRIPSLRRPELAELETKAEMLEPDVVFYQLSRLPDFEIVRRKLGKSETKKEKLDRLIRSTRIEIAEAAETREIISKGKYDYLKSEIGMNIILPEGSIDEMRFHVTLIAENKVVAIDGFPKDVIKEKNILSGKIKVGISKAFKFIPVFGDILAEHLEFELDPWEFKLGSLKRVNIDFSGGLTSQPEWYFKKDGIKNELRVALTIRKPRSTRNIKGKVKAAWFYDPGFLRKRRIGTDAKTIKIFNE